MLSLCLRFSGSVLALSVTYGDSSPKGGALGGEGCPLYKYTENPVGKGRSAGKTQKNRFPSCQTGQNALFYSHSLTV